MKKSLAIFALAAASLVGQNLTPQQKEADFRFMVSVYATYYSPLEWKKELLGFDGLDIKPWLAKIAATQTDLEFYDVCAEYVASFQDSHSFFDIPSNFRASLGMNVDIYDSKPLIETINRTTLPVASFPFAVGDEIVSVDGVPMEELIERNMRYAPQGNPRASRRLAAIRSVLRVQSVMPSAPAIGDTASVAIRLAATGNVETYQIPWTKSGIPLEVGPVPNPKSAAAAAAARRAAAGPSWQTELAELEYSGVSGANVEFGVLNYGSRNPIFVSALGAGVGFTRRLGGNTADFFYSGVFRQDGLTIGFLRIPSYSPPNRALALQQLDTEIAYFQANTDGLIIDQMRNTGGLLCFGEDVVRRLTTQPFAATGFAARATFARLQSFWFNLRNAKSAGAPPEIIERWEKLYAAMLEAYQSNRGVTAPLSLCSTSLEVDTIRDAAGRSTAYTKPILMMIDEFSTSTGDSVPAMFQENNLGVLYGYRSNGAGGNNISVAGGAYSESNIGITQSTQVRRSAVLREGYPYTAVIENVGVHPEVVEDYMTRENLLQNGAPFVQRFLWAAAAYIRQVRGQ